MDAALEIAIGRRVGGEIRDVAQIEQGEEATVWRADSDGGALVVHVGAAWRSVAEMAWTHAVARHAASTVPQAVAPRAAADGSTFFLHAGRPVTLFPFVAGRVLDKDRPALVDDSARLLARVHAALVDWDGGERPASRPDGPAPWDPRRDPPALVDSALDSWWSDAEPGLARGVVHGDWYRRNLLCRDDRVVGIVDWHEARIAPLAGEVAWAAWEMAHDDELRLDPARAARFLRAYGAGAPELPLAAALMRVWLRENVRLALALADHGQPLDELYFTRQLRAFAELRALAAT